MPRPAHLAAGVYQGQKTAFTTANHGTQNVIGIVIIHHHDHHANRFLQGHGCHRCRHDHHHIVVWPPTCPLPSNLLITCCVLKCTLHCLQKMCCKHMFIRNTSRPWNRKNSVLVDLLVFFCRHNYYLNNLQIHQLNQHWSLVIHVRVGNGDPMEQASNQTVI